MESGRTLQGYAVGTPVEGPAERMLREGGFADRAFMTCGSGIEIFVVLREMTKEEAEEFGRALALRAYDLNPPILRLEYPDLSFDVPVLCDRLEPEANAATVYAIESDPVRGRFVVRHIRSLGLDPSIVRVLAEANATDPKARMAALPGAYDRLDGGAAPAASQRFER